MGEEAAMSMPWWGWVAFVVMVLAGLGVLAAPFIGGALARRDVPLPDDRPSETWRSVRIWLKRALSWTLDQLAEMGPRKRGTLR
jgi:hypothetical protein